MPKIKLHRQLMIDGKKRKAAEIVDASDALAKQLVARGVAVPVADEPTPTNPPVPTPGDESSSDAAVDGGATSEDHGTHKKSKK